MLAAGFCYWMYWLKTLDVKPRMTLLHFDEPRDALLLLFFGALGSVYILLVVLFFLKFVYNLIQAGFDALIPRRLYSLSKPICYLIALNFAFLHGENIKVAGLTAYNQVDNVIQTAKEHDEMIEKGISGLHELLKDVDKGFSKTSDEE